jgi:hypothetical protein
LPPPDEEEDEEEEPEPELEDGDAGLGMSSSLSLLGGMGCVGFGATSWMVWSVLADSFPFLFSFVGYCA